MCSDERAPRIALLGGVPTLLGGGGLELQMRFTRDALAERGHDARLVSTAPTDWEFDVLHVIGHTGDIGHVMNHWRRNPARLVVSPVLVVPTRREWRLSLATRLPIPAFEPRVLSALVRRADHLVSLTTWEADFLRKVGRGRAAPVSVIGNGVDAIHDLEPVSSVGDYSLPEGFVVSVGAVSPRKRQLEIARTLRGVAPYVVIGGWDGPADQLTEFQDAVVATGGAWLGELTDRRSVLGVVAAARALVHLSEAEGQSLAVLEALSVGTYCVLSDLPQQRELADTWPSNVSIVSSEDEIRTAVAALQGPLSVPAASVPSWDDIAAQLGLVYETAMWRPAKIWSERG